MPGAKADGKGMDAPKGSSPQDSVDVSSRTDAPGGESKKGSHIRIEGPHGYRKRK